MKTQKIAPTHRPERGLPNRIAGHVRLVILVDRNSDWCHVYYVNQQTGAPDLINEGHATDCLDIEDLAITLTCEGVPVGQITLDSILIIDAVNFQRIERK